MLVLFAGGDARAAYIEDKTTVWLVALASESYDPAESGNEESGVKGLDAELPSAAKAGLLVQHLRHARRQCPDPSLFFNLECFFFALAVPFECPWASISSTSPSSLYI
jgi:hypothetical protein